MQTLSKTETNNGTAHTTTKTGMNEQSKQSLRARVEYLEKHHDLTTRKGILEWLAATGLALTHDLPEMPRQKANTTAYVASIALKSIQS